MPKHKPKSERYRQIAEGEREPEGVEKGWSNLQPEKYNFAVMDKERAREISRKGGIAVQKLHGEKRTAKQALEKILTLKVDDNIIAGAELPEELANKLKRDNPNATLYDLIQLVAVGKAAGGNMKAYELIRDTYGDKPVEKVDISADIMTDADRELMASISRRLQEKGAHIEVVKDVDTGE
jgi:general stress protein YciG